MLTLVIITKLNVCYNVNFMSVKPKNGQNRGGATVLMCIPGVKVLKCTYTLIIYSFITVYTTVINLNEIHTQTTYIVIYAKNTYNMVNFDTF